jgi:hypothetical protein
MSHPARPLCALWRRSRPNLFVGVDESRNARSARSTSVSIRFHRAAACRPGRRSIWACRSSSSSARRHQTCGQRHFIRDRSLRLDRQRRPKLSRDRRAADERAIAGSSPGPAGPDRSTLRAACLCEGGRRFISGHVAALLRGVVGRRGHWLIDHGVSRRPGFGQGRSSRPRSTSNGTEDARWKCPESIGKGLDSIRAISRLAPSAAPIRSVSQR